jgi:hypothetical protein
MLSTCCWAQGATMKYRVNRANARASTYGGSGDLGGNQ